MGDQDWFGSAKLNRWILRIEGGRRLGARPELMAGTDSVGSCDQMAE